MLSTILQLLPDVEEELNTELVGEVQDLTADGGPYDVVTPVSHCLFQVVCAAISFAQTFQALNTEELLLFLSTHTTHGAAQRGGHTEIGF